MAFLGDEDQYLLPVGGGVKVYERVKLAEGVCELGRYADGHAFCVCFHVISALEKAINRGKNPLDPEGVLAAM